MDYKRILTIQDISCVGQCSLTVALPILSACGLETAILPSAVLSTHTGGFSGYTFRDLSDDIPAINAHWQKENLKFEAVYTGYLGSTKQVDYIKEIFRTSLSKGGKKIVDPAMADNGKLYWGFDDVYVKAMASLCAEADVILPNITEACFMTGYEYKTVYDEAYVNGLLKELEAIGMHTVILTGVSYTADTTGALVYSNGKSEYYCHKKIAKSFHGTGDVYSSAFTGALLSGKPMFEAAKIAADYTVKCIENTMDDDSHFYGVKFETALGDLIGMLK